MERKDFLRQGGPCFYFDTELFAPTTDSFALGWFAAPKRGERVCDLGSGTGLLGTLLLAREQERAEQPCAAAEVAHAFAALRRGEPAEREAVGRRREELRIKIKAGAALPEKVLAFHEASVP